MSDSTLYLYTSLTAGSSHIVTATARLETILKANRIPFRAIDIATDDKARQLWGRQARGRKLPGLVKYRSIVGDIEEIEEWNEYGELRMQVDSVQDLDNFGPTTTSAETSSNNTPSTATTNTTTNTPPVENPTPKPSTIKIQSPPSKTEKKDDQRTLALRQASEEAASRAKESSRTKLGLDSTAEVKKDTESQSPSATTTTTTTTETTTTATTPPENQKEGATATHAENQEKGTATTSGESEKKDDQSGESGSQTKSNVDLGPKLRRPSLATENAAESTGNFLTDDAKQSGIMGHHHGSIVSATSPGEQAKVASDIRKSISEEPKDDVGTVREEHSIKKMQSQAKEEVSKVDEGRESRVENTEKVEVNKDGDRRESIREEKEISQIQDPKDAAKMNDSVKD